MPIAMASGVHKRRDPTPMQQRFPHRRRMAFPRSSALTLAKRQSTLTQLDDFFEMPPSSSRSRGDFKSEESSAERPKRKRALLEDSDEHEGLPAKNRKKNNRKAKKACAITESQDTLTQNWESHLRASVVSGFKENGFQVWEDRKSCQRAFSRQTFSPTRVHTTPTHRPGRVVILSSSAEVSPEQVPSSSISVDQSTRPTTAQSTIQPQTPRNTRRREVPSSETPASIKISSHSASLDDIYSRSPLKDRSVNVVSQEPMIPCETEQSDDAIPRKISWNDVTQVQYLDPVNPRKLRRTATVQDSQAESDLLALKRTLTRSSTIQDSQPDEAPASHTSTNDEEYDQGEQRAAELLEDHEEQETYHTYTQFPETYDPVNSALDRDALRFGQHEYDIDARVDIDHDNGGAAASSPQAPQEDDEFIDFIAQSPVLDLRNAHLSKERGDTRQRADLLPTRSSPPTLRPSQTTTVVPTQATINPPSSSIGIGQSSLFDMQSAPAWPQTLPSSPFPLPPIAGLGVGAERDDRYDGPVTQLEGSSDFSLHALPPPLQLHPRARKVVGRTDWK